jgi:hypothetical protein
MRDGRAMFPCRFSLGLVFWVGLCGALAPAEAGVCPGAEAVARAPLAKLTLPRAIALEAQAHARICTPPVSFSAVQRVRACLVPMSCAGGA